MVETNYAKQMFANNTPSNYIEIFVKVEEKRYLGQQTFQIVIKVTVQRHTLYPLQNDKNIHKLYMFASKESSTK